MSEAAGFHAGLRPRVFTGSGENSRPGKE